MTAPTTPGEKYAMTTKEEIEKFVESHGRCEACEYSDCGVVARHELMFRLLRERDAYREVAAAELAMSITRREGEPFHEMYARLQADKLKTIDAEALKLLTPTEGKP